MLQRIFHKILLRRHFWRYATFDEVAELYASRMLRMSAIYIVGSFMSIYLFQIGYSVIQIGLFWGAFYLFKAVISLPSTMLIAKIGPKHSILISNLLYIPAMVMFALLPEYGAWLLVPILLTQALSATMYAIAYNIDFSKVKSVEHAGKEIAYMNIIERVASGLSPLVGGGLAFFAGPQVVIVISAILFALASVPLFRTGEQVRTNVTLTFKGFPWRLLMRHALAQWSIGFDIFTSGSVWTLYTAVLIIGVSSNNEVYLVNGILLSVVFVAALVTSYMYGKIVDRKRGKQLMRAGVIANSLTHLMRPFTGNAVAVAGLNVANEMATTGYTLPYTRAVFDNADISGMRREYLGCVEALSNLGAGMAALTLALFAALAGEFSALTSFFFITAATALLVLTARFPLYRK